MYLGWIRFSNTVINRWAIAGAEVATCRASRPAVILMDRSEDRDNHGCYEQHFITVTFGQNSICRCQTCPPAPSAWCLDCEKGMHKPPCIHKWCRLAYYVLLTAQKVKVSVLFRIGGEDWGDALQTLSSPSIWSMSSFVCSMPSQYILWVVYHSHYRTSLHISALLQWK